MKGSVWEPGPLAHTAPLWANQSLSNYCEPSQALLRHALNFAQDRWGLLNMQKAQAFPLLTTAACVDNVIPVTLEGSYRAKNGYQQLGGKWAVYAQHPLFSMLFMLRDTYAATRLIML